MSTKNRIITAKQAAKLTKGMHTRAYTDIKTLAGAIKYVNNSIKVYARAGHDGVKILCLTEDETDLMAAVMNKLSRLGYRVLHLDNDGKYVASYIIHW